MPGNPATVTPVDVEVSIDRQSMAFSLVWNEEPQDLDLHLLSPYGHCYHGVPNPGNTELYKDDKWRYGPERINVWQGKDGVYDLYVYDWYEGQTGLLPGSGAYVVLTGDTVPMQRIYVPSSAPGLGFCWHVCRVTLSNDGQDADVEVINQWEDDPPFFP